jgi:gamma-glutamylcyclotransferase
LRCDKPNHVVDDFEDGIVVYRDPFQRALVQCIDRYRADLCSDKDLQMNFIRKFDDIAGIERCFYFAYGSNLDRDRIGSRVRYIHDSVKGRLDAFRFSYNKKSRDGTSKANIVRSPGESVWGVCYEIDHCDFRRLHEEYEKGYSVKDVWIDTGRDPIIAKTFISTSLTAASPHSEYARMIVEAARKHNFPEGYIERYLKKTVDGDGVGDV